MKEALADYAHKAWSHWMKYLFSKCIHNQDGSVTIPSDLVERWTRQLNTPYNNLSETEKESDRQQAQQILDILNRKE